MPVINKREVEYYSNTVDIEKMVSVFTDIEIIEYENIEKFDLSEDKNYYAKRLDDILGEGNYSILRNKGSENISIGPMKEEDKDYDDSDQNNEEDSVYPLLFPLIEYRERYYNIVVEREYITINELLKKGTFESYSNKNYSDDKRVVNSINIER